MEPEVSRTGQTFRIRWVDQQVELHASRIKEHSDRVTAEIVIRTTLPPYNQDKWGLLSQSTINLSSDTTRNTLIKKLVGLCAEANWVVILEEACLILLTELRRDAPIIELHSTDDWKPPPYLLRPMLPDGEITLMFGPRESGKSYLALLFALCCELPWHDNPCGWSVPSKPTKVLYLDWEMSERGLGWRLKQLSDGMGISPTNLFYQECRRPMADLAEGLANEVRERGIGLLIMDSVGMAARGELNSPETALELYRSIRMLGISSLLIAHTAKNKESGLRTVFGSSFFENYPRQIIEVRKSQETDASGFDVGLYHYKCNIDRKFAPLGLRFDFLGGEVTVNRTDITSVAELAERLSIPDRIKGLLRDAGPMSGKDIADELGVSQSTIRTTICRRKDVFCRLETGLYDIV